MKFGEKGFENLFDPENKEEKFKISESGIVETLRNLKFEQKEQCKTFDILEYAARKTEAGPEGETFNKEVEDHIKTCSSCRLSLLEAESALAMPITQAEKEKIKEIFNKTEEVEKRPSSELFSCMLRPFKEGAKEETQEITRGEYKIKATNRENRLLIQVKKRDQTFANGTVVIEGQCFDSSPFRLETQTDSAGTAIFPPFETTGPMTEERHKGFSVSLLV